MLHILRKGLMNWFPYLPWQGKHKPWRPREEVDGKKNPIQTISITPKWYGSATEDMVKIATQMLTGYIWAIKHDPMFIAVHKERQEAESLLHRFTYWGNLEYGGKNHGDQKGYFDNSAEAEIQLALIDFIRFLPFMWD